VTVREPSLSKNPRSLLSVSFGQVSDVPFPDLALQLRVELLSRYAVFDKDLIEPLVPKLEDKIIEFIPLERRRAALASHRTRWDKPSAEETEVVQRLKTITDGFDLLLEDLARAYGDKHALLLAPRYVLAPGSHYHIAGRVVARKDFDHKELKALVERYFDKGPLDYRAPQVAILSREGGRVLRVDSRRPPEEPDAEKQLSGIAPGLGQEKKGPLGDIVGLVGGRQKRVFDEDGEGSKRAFGLFDIEALPSDPTLAAQFVVELLRRHPVLGERFLQSRLDTIEKSVAKQLETEHGKPDSPADGRSEQPYYAGMFENLFLDYVAENDLAVVQVLLADGTISTYRRLPGGNVESAATFPASVHAHVHVLSDGGIMIKAAANVKMITFVPGLVYRYAEKTGQPISPLHKIVTKPGDRAALETGKYVYRLEFADDTLSDYRPLRLPSDLDKDDPRTLHIASDPDEKGRPGSKPSDKPR
jgi:hypothetical protein